MQRYWCVFGQWKRASPPFCKILDVAGLGLDVGFGDVDLHVESVGDAASQRLLGVARAATPSSQG